MQHGEADQRLGDEEQRGGARTDAARRQGPAPGARDAGVEIAIEDVVIGAAGAAHGDRADQEQQQMPNVGPAMDGVAGERGRPPAWREQQLPPGRPVEPRELHVGKRKIGRQPQDQTVGTRVGQRAVALGLGGQRGPAGSGWACGPPPSAACSFAFFISPATLQALAAKAALLT